ncbi:WhiB family transcriptional regulator [Streptomyces agglomeratus]|uniref:Transcriptional regulator WhiB n=2 Tax=Streptomyces agglomeratus TaxID=285458 RepID=A0A1E5P1B8_9ACTN|nr:WhiB family transcriptional regulator [Streptomyces agglomeratus]OEJ23287.1 WhiB family transcriptional regulator [Streptomyces agglomeratus]OEJ55205.1 WhiB family transcriptional regulator [Streptomyces agglomeratus]OEJ62579.1 WhiB family transcriptional regulator [Streptomyces agglomeratus]
MTSSSAQWSEGAACRSSHREDLFADAARQNRAKTVCSGCPVRIACLAEALDNRIEFGVWGGMTERERRALLRRRPHVTSWRQVLESARSAHEQSRASSPAPASTASPARHTG